MISTREQYSVAALERGLELLQIMAHEDRAYSLQEIVELASLPKTTVFRLLATLERKGFVERTAEGRYRIGLQLGRVGRFAHATFDLRRISDQQIRRLLEFSNDTVNLAAWRNDQVIYVDVLPTPLRAKIVELPGTIAPIHASALGKAIAAHLPERDLRRILGATGLPALTPRSITSVKEYIGEVAKVRTRGFAYDREETDLGASCIGAPVFDSTGVVGAVSLSATTARMTKARLRTLVPELVDACRQISEKLGAKFNHSGQALIGVAAQEERSVSQTGVSEKRTRSQQASTVKGVT